METQFCTFCNKTGWVDVRVDPVPPWSDFMSVDQDVESCPICGQDGSFEAYSALSDEIRDQIPYYFAQAVGGFEGQYGLFEHFQDGELVRSILVDRSVYNPTSWQPPQPIDDCPVCLGWGIWSNNGHIYDCIACGGHPIESRHGYEPLCAWWLRELWPGGSRIFRQRGAAGSNDCLSTSEMLRSLDSMPGLTVIN